MLNFFKNTEKVHQKSYFPELDGLRGLAVIFVFIFHLNETGMMKGGFIGVDMFFVISGFIMTKILYQSIENHQFSYRTFIAARIARLYPALICVLFVSLIAGYLIYTPDYYINSAKSGFSALLSYSNWFFAKGVGYWALEQVTDPFLHTWSLGVELQFYLIWPVMVLLLIRLLPQHIWLISSFLLIILIILISLGSSYFFGDFQNNATLAFFSTFSRIFEFAMGSLLFIYQYHYSKVNNKLTTSIISEVIIIGALSFLVFSAMYFDKNTLNYPNGITMLIIIATVLCINNGTHAKYTGWFLRNKFILSIGLLSYSIYLVHWPFIVFTRYFFNEISGIWMHVIVILAILFLSLTLYVGVENRYRRLKIFDFQSSITSLWYLLVFIVLAGSQYIIYAKGFPNREKFQMSQEMEALLKGYAEIGIPSGYIVIGDTTQEPSFIITGDSYARQYMQSFDELLKNKKVAAHFFNRPACSYVQDIKAEWRYDVKNCIAEQEQLYQLIQEEQLPIIYIQRFGHFLPFKNNSFINNTFQLYYSEIPYLARYEENLKMLLNDAPADIMIFNSQPDYYFDTRDVFRRNMYDKEYLKRFTYHPYNIKMQNAIGNQLLDKVLAETNKVVEYVDILGVLCQSDANKCRVLDEQLMPLYSDGAHLSVNGIHYVWQKIEPQICNFIDKNTNQH
ncbi:MAG: acyltransferase family protein [Wohlfahrtiimonas sp.]